MRTKEQHSLQIAAIGLGEKMTNALSLFFKGSCQIACVLAPEDSAAVCIVDLDDFQGRQRLEGLLRRSPQRPVIALSLHEKALDGAICLRKPVKSTQLFKAIEQASAQLSRAAEKAVQVTLPKVQGTQVHASQIPAANASNTDVEVADQSVAESTPADQPERQIQRRDANRSETSTHRAAMFLDGRSTTTYIGSARDVDFSDQEQVAKAQYDPNDFLQSYLARAFLEAASKGFGVIVECQPGSITIGPDATQVSTTINEHKLRTLSRVPIIEGTVSLATLDRAQCEVKHEGTHKLEKEALMWKTALWAARGRVPAGTSFMIPVEMRRWPNLTQLMVFPHALRIAALWAKEPYSLMATAKRLSIPQRNVFAFYSAAHAIGLVSMAESDSVSLIKPKPSVTQGRKGILSRIINRLRWQ